MKVLIIDVQGNALDYALRCQEAGHEVRWFIRKNKEGNSPQIGNGLVPRVPHWEPSMNWADLIFLTDNTYYMTDLEPYRRKGYPIFGANFAVAQWELDRNVGQDIFTKAGIPVIPTKEFSNYDEAIKHVKETMGRFVSKPTGDGSGEESKALSYVSKTPADMVYMLQRWKKNKTYKGKFILQEFVGGIEMAVGAWCGANGMSKYYCENWEFKKLMNDDLGVATGEQGTVLRYTKDSLLAERVLKPLEPFLMALNYTGYIDVNCIIDKKGNPWPLEFTSRPGWPLFQIQQAVHGDDPCQWMLDMIDGKDSFKPSDKIAIGVVMAMPDYPYSRLTKKEVTGVPVYNVEDSSYKDSIHLCEIMMGEAPYMDGDKIKEGKHLVSAGDYLLVCSGTAYTVEMAKERVYRVVDSIDVPNSIMYRTDIGCRLKKQLPELHRHGYVEDMEYD